MLLSKMASRPLDAVALTDPEGNEFDIN